MIFSTINIPNFFFFAWKLIGMGPCLFLFSPFPSKVFSHESQSSLLVLLKVKGH